MWSIGGMLTWLRTVADVVDEYWSIWKIIARCALKPANALLQISPQVVAEFERLSKAVVDYSPQPLARTPRPQHEVIIVSDAAKQGPFASWGFVLPFCLTVP